MKGERKKEREQGRGLMKGNSRELCCCKFFGCE
jgi:hypothetical protein